MLEARFDQLQVIKEVLLLFQGATRLKMNFYKSCMVLINVDACHTMVLAQFFGYIVGSMPFTYLGLPLGTTKLTVNDLAHLVNMVERLACLKKIPLILLLSPLIIFQ